MFQCGKDWRFRKRNLRVIGLQSLLQPGLRRGVGAGIVIQLQDGGFQVDVVFAGGKQFHQLLEAFVLLCVKGLYNSGNGILLQQFPFVVIQHAEVGGNAELVKVLPDQRGAKGVNGADFGGRNQ